MVPKACLGGFARQAQRALVHSVYAVAGQGLSVECGENVYGFV